MTISCQTHFNQESSITLIWNNQFIKGALDNFSLILLFFKKVEIFTPLEVYTYTLRRSGSKT